MIAFDFITFVYCSNFYFNYIRKTRVVNLFFITYDSTLHLRPYLYGTKILGFDSIKIKKGLTIEFCYYFDANGDK